VTRTALVGREDARQHVAVGVAADDQREVLDVVRLGLHERLRRTAGRVPDAAEGAEEPDAQPDADGGRGSVE